MGGFRAVFHGVRDPRRSNASKYDLIEMLAVAFPATLSVSSSCAGFARYVECNCGFLKEFMELKGGPPSHDAFSDVSDAIDVEQMAAALTEFAKTLPAATTKMRRLNDASPGNRTAGRRPTAEPAPMLRKTNANAEPAASRSRKRPPTRYNCPRRIL